MAGMGPGMGMRGGGGRRNQGTVKMPPGGWKTAARMFKMLLGSYKWSLLLVALCILVTTATTLTSTLFTRTLTLQTGKITRLNVKLNAEDPTGQMGISITIDTEFTNTNENLVIDESI